MVKFLFFYILAFSVFCDGIFSAILQILAGSDFSFKKKKIYIIFNFVMVFGRASLMGCLLFLLFLRGFPYDCG